MKKATFLVILLLMSSFSFSQDFATERPEIWGIAKMTFQVNDIELACEYYGDFLGFEEAFSYSAESGKVSSFKINDRQFLEFTENKQAKTGCTLFSVSFECDDLVQMQSYLKSENVSILKEVSMDKAGNETLVIASSESYNLEFISFKDDGLHRLSKEHFLGENRISTRLHHAGLFISDVAKADSLYRGILGFTEMWRFKDDNTVIPNFIYQQIPDCVENIEYVVVDDSNASHPCFRVDDMQQTVYDLRSRKGDYPFAKPAIGKGNRWLLNLISNQGARIEFTESFTIR